MENFEGWDHRVDSFLASAISQLSFRQKFMFRRPRESDDSIGGESCPFTQLSFKASEC